MAKKKITFYVEEKVIEDFRKKTETEGLIQSKWIENKMSEFINSKKK